MLFEYSVPCNSLYDRPGVDVVLTFVWYMNPALIPVVWLLGPDTVQIPHFHVNLWGHGDALQGDTCGDVEVASCAAGWSETSCMWHHGDLAHHDASWKLSGSVSTSTAQLEIRKYRRLS